MPNSFPDFCSEIPPKVPRDVPGITLGRYAQHWGALPPRPPGGPRALGPRVGRLPAASGAQGPRAPEVSEKSADNRTPEVSEKSADNRTPEVGVGPDVGVGPGVGVRPKVAI